MKPMVTVEDFYNVIDSFAPFNTAMNFDNCGILVGKPALEVTGALVSLDVTQRVIDEAVEKGANLIITHHPVIFSPLKNLSYDSLPYRLAAEGISVISAHTNLDIAKGGVNDCLATTLGLKNIRPLEVISKKPFYKIAVFTPTDYADAVFNAISQAGGGVLGGYKDCAFTSIGQGSFTPLNGANPFIGQAGKLQRVEEVKIEMLVDPNYLQAVIVAIKKAHPYEEVAYDLFENHGIDSRLSLGRIGELDTEMGGIELAEAVAKKISVSHVKVTTTDEKISTVALCGGSGGDLIGIAKSKGAQALVVGECKYSQTLEAAQLGITLIEAGHYYTEAVVLKPLTDLLKSNISGVAIEVAQSCADPGVFV